MLAADEVKDVLARTELCSHLIQLAQTNVQENAEYSEDNLQKVKMASDLLILLLTGGKYLINHHNRQRIHFQMQVLGLFACFHINLCKFYKGDKKIGLI
ncbi:hypothetical protein DPMN_181912 [Dreissena polymorpha]|uniref:Uncharacterized protein n=1 Tax=Dreissena polymorpha TaxID=45954 RepID=A0A9D4DFD9_DREPO|nr:hypothetical protein DPMN_181912 [Dreissena polymorpha]